MTSGLVLNEFNLDLSPPGLLVGLGLVVIVVVVLAALAGVGVIDEGVFGGFVAGPLVGHGGGRSVSGLGHVWGAGVAVDGREERGRIWRVDLAA